MNTLVDIHGLAELLNIKKRTMQRTWREYPHVFPGTGGDARSARFIIEDVLAFLTSRDYSKVQQDAILRQKEKAVGRTGEANNKRRKSKSPLKPAPLEAKKTRDMDVPQIKKVVQDKDSCFSMGKLPLGSSPVNRRSSGQQGAHDILIHLR